jgi:hypothetical protein
MQYLQSACLMMIPPATIIGYFQGKLQRMGAFPQ